MQVYRQLQQKGDPNDLIALAILGGALLNLAALHREMPTPRVWKGAVPKKIHHQRLRADHRWIGTQQINADTLDAIGLALYGVKKCTQKR